MGCWWSKHIGAEPEWEECRDLRNCVLRECRVLRKRSAFLSITHKLNSNHDAEFDVRKSDRPLQITVFPVEDRGHGRDSRLAVQVLRCTVQGRSCASYGCDRGEVIEEILVGKSILRRCIRRGAVQRCDPEDSPTEDAQDSYQVYKAFRRSQLFRLQLCIRTCGQAVGSATQPPDR